MKIKLKFISNFGILISSLLICSAAIIRSEANKADSVQPVNLSEETGFRANQVPIPLSSDTDINYEQIPDSPKEHYLLPEGSVFYEAEDLKVIPPARIEVQLHASGMKYITVEENSEFKKPVEILRMRFPESDPGYTLWVYSRNVKMGLLGENYSNLNSKFNLSDAEWQWHDLGRYTRSEVGRYIRIYALFSAENENKVRAGIDCFIFSPCEEFVPSGMYFGYGTFEGKY